MFQVKTAGSSSVLSRVTTIVDSPIEDPLFCWIQGHGHHHRAPLVHARLWNHDFHGWTRTWGLVARFLSWMVRNSVAHDGSLDDGSNGFTETFYPGHIPPTNIAPMPHTVLRTQPVSDLSLGSFSSTRYFYVNPSTDVSIS